MDNCKKFFLRAVSGLFVALMLLASGPVLQALAEDFSADMVSRAGKETIKSKIYVSGDKSRVEMPENIMIIRGDKKISWIIMPSEKMYMEHPIVNSQAPKTAKNFDNETERKSLGMETIDGKPAEKFEVTYMEKNKPVRVYQWIRDGKLPVKTEAVDGSWGTEYKNISTAKQPESLFEVPEGYQSMAMPSMGSIMSNMLGK